MAPVEHEAFANALRGDPAAVVSSLGRLDYNAAEATVPHDKERIMEAIRNAMPNVPGVGQDSITSFNESVRALLRRTIASLTWPVEHHPQHRVGHGAVGSEEGPSR